MFWIDTWFGEFDFRSKLPCIFALETDPLCNISERCTSSNGHSSYVWAWRRNPRDGLEMEQFNELVDMLNNIDLNKMAIDMSKFSILMFDGKMGFTVWKMTIRMCWYNKPFVQTMLTGRTTLTFEDVLKALRDNERMTGSDSSSRSDKLLVADDSGRGVDEALEEKQPAMMKDDVWKTMQKKASSTI
nr:RNA-directed DNA polymerase, eukaryota, reverse transcriptase zinc-binding domain protein [Tanacetum cinerariifolium]